MSRQQRRQLHSDDIDIRDTEHGDIWYTRAGVKYLMDKSGKIVTSYKVSGDSRPTKIHGKPPPSDYEILKAAGHSPLMALQIVTDAERGDQHAIDWLKTAKEQHK